MNKLNQYLIVLGIICFIILILIFYNLTFLYSVRIVFGSLLVLFIPGLLITEILFPKQYLIERVALSFALSISLIPLFFYYLNLMGIRINLLNSLFFLLLLMAVLVVALYLKKRPNFLFNI